MKRQLIQPRGSTRTAILILLGSLFFIPHCHTFSFAELWNTDSNNQKKSEEDQTKNETDSNELNDESNEKKIENIAEVDNETQEKAKNPDSIPNDQKGYKDLVKDKKGKLIRTVFYGAELIREEAIVKGIPVQRTILQGGATIIHEGIVITSPRIVIDAGVLGRCEGGIQVYDKTNGVTLRARAAEYNKLEQRIELSGDPYLVIQKPGQNRMLVTTNKIVRNLADSISSLDGDVRFFQEGWTMLADQGLYFDKESRLELKTDPVVLGKQVQLSGNKIEYFAEKKQILLSGQVYSTFRSETSLGGGKKQPRELTLEKFARNGGRILASDEKEKSPFTMVTAENLLYTFHDSNAPVSELSGNVRLESSEMTIKTEKLNGYGKGFETLQSDVGVEMIDLSQGIELTAGILDYERKAQLLRLRNSPEVKFLDKKGKGTNAVLKAEVIERNLASKETQARGKVRIESDEFAATGEIANYKEEGQLIVLEGSPALEQGQGRIQSDRILIFPEKKKTLLSGRIRGSLSD